MQNYSNNYFRHLILVTFLFLCCLRGSEFARAWKSSAASEGGPWSNSTDHAEFAQIISTSRGASTEVAEYVGSHPCAVSFNEILYHNRFPSNYEKRYIQNGDYKKYLKLSHINGNPSNWLSSIKAARTTFCQGRPTEVKDVCGDVCVVALKIHINLSKDYKEKFKGYKNLLAYKGSGVIVVERDFYQVYCSIDYARNGGGWGHKPSQGHVKPKPNCTKLVQNNKKAKEFVQSVTKRFNETRAYLQGKCVPSLELPFTYFVSTDAAAVKEALFRHLGLISPPKRWRDTCSQPWCPKYSWPKPSHKH